MLRLLTLALLVLAPALVRAADAPVEKPPVTIKGWGDVTDPDGDCTVAADGDRVTVSVPATAHDLAAELDRRNAPRILAPVRGDFVIEVKVAGEFHPEGPGTIDGRAAYNGAGILAQADADNYVTLHRAAFVKDDGTLQHYLNFELRKGAKLVTSRFEISVEDGKDAFLRLERRGNKFYGSVSQDELTWRAYEPIEAKLARKLSCGVEVVNSSKNPFECVFEALAIFRKAATPAK